MKVIGGLFLALLVVLAVGWFWYLQPELQALSATGARAGDTTFEVPMGTTQKNVIQRFEQQGFVKDWRILYGYTRVMKLGAPKAGEYTFEPSLSVLEMFQKMRRGEVTQYTIGFPEGLTYKEIAARLEPTGFIKAAELIKACEDPAFLKENRVPGITCEGYLFPDTYKIVKGKTTRELTAMFIAHQHEVFAKMIAPHIGALKLTPAEIVTLASIVEKETGAPEERPHIAGLFLNRLKINKRLETDPTVIYAVSLTRGSFDGNIHRADLLFDHPYNTYKRAGLPPGPISNPGLKALEAVVRPTTSDDLYFVAQGAGGKHVFCPTFECHLAAVEKYQIAPHQKKKK